MKIHESPWKPMEVHGNPCLAIPGKLANLIHGNPWKPTKIHGNPWKFMETRENP